jgi:hypothetical protein
MDYRINDMFTCVQGDLCCDGKPFKLTQQSELHYTFNHDNINYLFCLINGQYYLHDDYYDNRDIVEEGKTSNVYSANNLIVITKKLTQYLPVNTKSARSVVCGLSTS